MRLLLVEDDAQIASFICKGFREAGFVIDHVGDGLSGMDLLLEEKYDAAIVDIMLPKLDGISLIDRIRNKKVITPVLILSAKRSVGERVEGLQSGADDYLVKPFAFSELLARIQALIRRSRNIAEPTLLSVGDLMMDTVRKKVTRANKPIDFQPKELMLLEYLMRNKGKVVSKTMIMDNVWDYNFVPQTNIVESCISRIREKVDRSYTDKLIHTLKGIGYVLESKE